MSNGIQKSVVSLYRVESSIADLPTYHSQQPPRPPAVVPRAHSYRLLCLAIDLPDHQKQGDNKGVGSLYLMREVLNSNSKCTTSRYGGTSVVAIR